jgi:hypothetical protein
VPKIRFPIPLYRESGIESWVAERISADGFPVPYRFMTPLASRPYGLCIRMASGIDSPAIFDRSGLSNHRTVDRGFRRQRSRARSARPETVPLGANA